MVYSVYTVHDRAKYAYMKSLLPLKMAQQTHDKLYPLPVLRKTRSIKGL